MGRATTGRPLGRVDHRGPLSTRGVEMESHRASLVQPNQRQLGRRTAQGLRNDRRLHPQHNLVERSAMPGSVGYDSLSDSRQNHGGTKEIHQDQTKQRLAAMELHDLPEAQTAKLFLSARLPSATMTLASAFQSGLPERSCPSNANHRPHAAFALSSRSVWSFVLRHL